MAPNSRTAVSTMRLGGAEVGHAVVVGDRRAAAGADRGDHLVGDAGGGTAAVHVGSQVVDDDGRTLRGQQLRDGASDPAARTGDDRRAALQSVAHR